MILKNSDDKSEQLSELEHLLSIAPSILKPRIETDLRMLRAGIKGETEAAYLINFDLGDAKNTFVIHDLRLEFKGRVAQIDHLILHRSLKFFVIESKHFHAGIKVTETGEFLQWNAFKKTFEGMPSPFSQNERHVAVLKDVLSKLIDMPTRLGVKLEPEFRSIVAIDSEARIDRPKNFDTSDLVKADQLNHKLKQEVDGANLISALAKLVSEDTIRDIGIQLIHFHRPIKFNYAAKYGLESHLAAIQSSPIQERPLPEPIAEAKPNTLSCRKCGSSKLSIQYGKFGYYFKCSDCEGNTPINITCGKDGHKERIRKDGAKFFRECAVCGTSSLFFENSTA